MNEPPTALVGFTIDAGVFQQPASTFQLCYGILGIRHSLGGCNQDAIHISDSNMEGL
jgi:hypothetical protein